MGQALTWYNETDPGPNLCAEIPPGSSVQVRFQGKANCYVRASDASIRVWYYDCCESTQRTADGSRPLTITKVPATVALDYNNPNNEVMWTTTVRNTGTASADWVRVEDTLGASLEYVSSSPPATPMGTQRWGWEFGPLGPNESQRNFRLRVEEVTTGWPRGGYFKADFGETLPVNVNSTCTINPG